MGIFDLNVVGMAELRRSPLLVAALKDVADKGAEESARLAPVGGDDDPHAGTFRDSMRSDAGIEGDGAVGRFCTVDPAGAFKEFGTVDTPAHPTLRRAMDTLGHG